MKKLFLLPTCVAMICLVQACSSVSETTATDTAKTDTTAMATNFIPDTVFMAKAAIGGMAEVELANLALANSTNSNIKDFANMMVADHSKANAELDSIAKTKNFVLPKKLDTEHQAKRDSLNKLTGANFDRAYAASMVEGHQKMLNLMQTEASTGLDTKLKDFAAKTAPVVQMHLEHAKTLQVNIK